MRLHPRGGHLLIAAGVLLLLGNAGYIVFIQVPAAEATAERIRAVEDGMRVREAGLERERRASAEHIHVLTAQLKSVQARLEGIPGSGATAGGELSNGMASAAGSPTAPAPGAQEKRIAASSSAGDVLSDGEGRDGRATNTGSIGKNERRKCDMALCRSGSCCGFSHPANECGGCGPEAKCHPGAECYAAGHATPGVREANAQLWNISLPTSAAARRVARATQLERATLLRRPAAGNESALCSLLLSRGFCSASNEPHIKRFCNVSCLLPSRKLPRQVPLAHRPWAQQSIFDARSRDAGWCSSQVELAKLEPPGVRCADLEDPSRVRDRGFFVARGVVSAAGLQLMRDHVASIPQPARGLCGVAGIQPGECMWNPHSGGIEPWVQPVYAFLAQLLEDWLASGFAREADLGWPLTITSGEVIAINGWGLRQNVSCLFQALMNAASALPDGGGMRACLHNSSCPASAQDARSFCWTRCVWESITTRLPLQTIDAIVQRARVDATCAAPPPGASLGSFAEDETRRFWNDPDRGWRHGFWDVPAPPAYSYRRLVSEMRAWLTKASNTTLCGGFHDWHMDGPGTAGRKHKAFVLISKGGGPGQPPPPRNATNLVLVPASLRYAHNCELGLGKRPSGDWLDEHSCSVAMDPGDVLFFREDVFHRTQDVLHDRYALILDINRFPLASSVDLAKEEVISRESNRQKSVVVTGVLRRDPADDQDSE